MEYEIKNLKVKHSHQINCKIWGLWIESAKSAVFDFIKKAPTQRSTEENPFMILCSLANCINKREKLIHGEMFQQPGYF